MAGSSASQSTGSSQSYSDTYIPDYSETPILEEIAQHARSMSDQVYNWGMNVYGNNQGNIDGMMRDALSYASPQRIAVDMGMAESGVQQGVEQGRQSAIRDLQSYGIDPSSGRYAALDSANRVMGAATAAGAGNQQRMADQAAGNVMRNQAISAGLQNANFGLGVNNAANAYLGTAIKLPYPPLGRYSEATSQNQSTSASQQSDPASGGGGGKGGGGEKKPSEGGGGGGSKSGGKQGGGGGGGKGGGAPGADPGRAPPGGGQMQPKGGGSPGKEGETPSGMDLEFNPFGDNQRPTGMDLEFNPFGDTQRPTGMDLEFNPFGDTQRPTGMDLEFNPFPAQETPSGMDMEFNPLPAQGAMSGTYDPYAGGVAGMDMEFNPFAAPAGGGQTRAADAGQPVDPTGSVYALGPNAAWTGEGLTPAGYVAPQADFGGPTYSDIGQGTMPAAAPAFETPSGMDQEFNPFSPFYTPPSETPSGMDQEFNPLDPNYGNFGGPTDYGDYGAGYNDPGYTDYGAGPGGDYGFDPSNDPGYTDYGAGEGGDYGFDPSNDPGYTDYGAGEGGDYGFDPSADYTDNTSPDYYGDPSGYDYGYDPGTDNTSPDYYGDPSGYDYGSDPGYVDYGDSGGGDYYSDGGGGDYDYGDSGGDYARGGPVKKGRQAMPFPMARANGRPPRRSPPTGYRAQLPGFRRGGPMPPQGMRPRLDPPKPMPGRRGPGRGGGPMPAMPGNFISANGMPPPAAGGLPGLGGPPAQAPRAPLGVPPLQPRPPQRPPQQQFAGGGQVADPTTGGFVSRDLSPSGGSQTDDVNARLNAGEFVIPKDVAAWKGKEFFYKLIAQARKLRSAGNQPEKPKTGYAGGGPFNPGMMQGAATRPLSSYQTPAQLPVNQQMRPQQSPFGRGMQ